MHGHARDQDDNIPIGLHSFGKKVDILAYDYFFSWEGIFDSQGSSGHKFLLLGHLDSFGVLIQDYDG